MALSNYAFIDLEVDQNNQIYRMGVVSPDLELDTQDQEAIGETLTRLRSQGLLICGHNFRRFDYTHVISHFPELQPWSVIDTLELAVLGFPLERSHKLNKEYKLSEYAGNHPLEDAIATQLLFEKILDTFSHRPQALVNFYGYLLSCGEDEASQAYQQLFAAETRLIPDLGKLPPEAIAGIDTASLHQLIAEAPTSEFDQRLCVAGMIAWNYESNLHQTRPPLSLWLSHRPNCPSILNHLKPLKLSQEFTYQPYLEKFGLTEFRGNQETAIQSILAAQNPLVLMATGGGKSLCYQLPALMLSERQRGLTVVISPLQSLMEDQVNGLTEKGFDFATFINGNIRPIERRDRLEQLRNGEKDLLYISPEQLRSPSIRALLSERRPSLLVFDETHCISQWGHDFRPDYRYAPKYFSEIYKEREQPLIALLTATATSAVRQDIKELFAQHQILIQTEIRSSTVRSNLTYEIIPTAKQNKDLMLLTQVKQAIALGGAVLVYTTTRKNAERVCHLLNQKGIEATFYHGKIARDDKQAILQKFKAKELDVIVATCAFGMGIDRPDVRAVIHHTLSGNLEAYVQEAGRAGRDGEPATCTLLFDPQDADMAYFLQSLNQLSEPEIRNLFLAVRSLREQIYRKASEEYFWVSASEIFQASDLDEEFASENEQRDTKIKVALHYLETFGMIEREENQSNFIEFNLVHPVPKDSLTAFDRYAHQHHLPDYRKVEFHRLIQAMHLAKAYCQHQDQPYPLERLSDAAGLLMKDLKQRIGELKKANVCTSKMPVTILITKSLRSSNDARKKYKSLQKREQQIAEEIVQLMGDRPLIQINCRALATRLDPDRQEKLSSGTILQILEGWSFLKWIRYQMVRQDVVKITTFVMPDYVETYQRLIHAIIDVFYAAIEKIPEADLAAVSSQTKANSKKTHPPHRISQDLVTVLSEVNQRTSPLVWELEDLEKALAWMHRHALIRLADGSNLFQQLMKIRVVKGANKDKVTREYPKSVKPHYEEQARRTHIMLDYGNHHDQPDFHPQDYIDNYFSLPTSEFSTQYPHTSGEAAKRPVTQEDYDRIITPLNPIQRQIICSEAPTIAVIAGPGSGKTRTIVHRIAYLVKVKRVDPARIIALAYNRNAVRELRLRLQNLIGDMAFRLRVYTFHGLALAILGRTIEPTRDESQPLSKNTKDPDQKFAQLIKDACSFLESSLEPDEEGIEDQETQLSAMKFFGKCEYIFVDEYQDIAEYEYQLVKLIAGFHESEDQTRSVQTQICVIGDDDQNIYGWRHTHPEYIRSFQTEYQAQQFLLTENYRSTEPIIAAANRLIQKNGDRLKRTGDEQVRIDNARAGQGGLEVQSLRFQDDNHQAAYIKQQVEKWIKHDGVQPGAIAILAKHWKSIDKARALLERRAGIPTYSLKGEAVKLIRNYVTQRLIAALEKSPDLVLAPEESVRSRFVRFFEKSNYKITEPTVKTLLKIAEDLDRERGYGSEILSVPITSGEIVTSIYEFSESPDTSIDPEAVLVTSCHGAKGLEFKYVILIADGFETRQDKIESERRLFYVAMTRAKEKLLLTHSQNAQFVEETAATPFAAERISINPPQFVFYSDFSPEDVHLSFNGSREEQERIKQLREGDALQLIATATANNWTIRSNRQIIGLLSSKAANHLISRGIRPGQFSFQPTEVTVKNVYRQVEIDEVTGDQRDEWYVVIPQIQICR